MDVISPSPCKPFDSQCLQQASQVKIFFAHMSVGYNIIDGVKTILKEHSTSLPVVETDDPAHMTTPGLYHARLGFNGDPKAKIRSFESQMAKIASANPNIVLMKLCYVDIKHGQKIRDLFESYRQSMDQLQKKYPAIRFVHCTVPLTSEPPTFKHKIKSAVKPLFGKSTWVQDNKTRMDFNNLLRLQYSSDSIFDIAIVESLTPDGHFSFVSSGHIQVPVLYRGYTNDGGHLTPIGQRYIAEQFMMTLTEGISASFSKP